MEEEKQEKTLILATLYLSFAVLMIVLNILIQNLHDTYIINFIREHWGNSSFIQKWYLSTDPYNMPELIGSTLAVSITYILKFFIDKYIVFKESSGKTDLKKTRKEFLIYFILAILTTIENIAIQFILGMVTSLAMNVRIIISLTCGYITKFFLDKKYVFIKEEYKEIEIEKAE